MLKVIFITTVILFILFILLKAKNTGEFSKCNFCNKKSVWIRRPNPTKILESNTLDIEPSEAEMSIVTSCEECLTIAGTFETTIWKRLSFFENL